jgi:diaminopimelate decarboxylase
MSLQQIFDERGDYCESAFYIYDEKVIDKNIEQFKSIPYRNTTIHFASMANDSPYLLKKLAQNGFGLFVNSRKHLQLGLESGFPASKIIFASTGINPSLMKELIARHIRINIDSIRQLKLYGALNPGSTVGIRMNIDEKSKNNVFNGMESRIGILVSEIDEIKSIAEYYNLTIDGTHVYLGTDVISLDELLNGVKQTLLLSDAFEDLRIVDLGGGFPLEKKRFDFEQYKIEITKLLESYSQKRGREIELILEPGRSMFGDAGHFYCQVTDIKERPDRFIINCNASASLIPRSIFYEDYNPVSSVQGKDGTETFYDRPVDIVGSTTYSRDYMAKNVVFPVHDVGDWICFDNAGSYCYSMITRFLGQAIPDEYLLTKSGGVIKIREGDQFFKPDIGSTQNGSDRMMAEAS